MACHLLVNKLLPESMLTKTSHHMASLAHNVSNGHLIRNLHISSVLWPLCISCFNTGDVLHKEWCLTTDYHLHQDDPLQVSSLTTRQIWGIWKLRPAYNPETPNLGQNQWCFVPCDLEICWMTLQNNRASLLCCFKLCATFHSHRSIQTWVTVRKRPIWVKFNDL